jgi:hypothetical protein
MSARAAQGVAAQISGGRGRSVRSTTRGRRRHPRRRKPRAPDGPERLQTVLADERLRHGRATARRPCSVLRLLSLDVTPRTWFGSSQRESEQRPRHRAALTLDYSYRIAAWPCEGWSLNGKAGGAIMTRKNSMQPKAQHLVLAVGLAVSIVLSGSGPAGIHPALASELFQPTNAGSGSGPPPPGPAPSNHPTTLSS